MEKNLYKSDLPVFSKELAARTKDVAVFALSGPLGAGKTTLVQSVLKHLGVTGPIQSPTYTYVSVYHLPENKTVYHFDLYRINSLDEFIAAGFDEYLYRPDSWCFIEWPEVIVPLLKERLIFITLSYGKTSDTRQVSLSEIK